MTTSIIPNCKRRVSASAMNTYFKCPRLYYYKYIEFIQEPPSIHLEKGKVVHEVLQIFFDRYETDLNKRMLRLLDDTWKLPEGEFSAKEQKEAYKDVKHLLLMYLNSLEMKYEALINSGKSKQHAFYLTRPKFREKRIEIEKYNLVGIIDTVKEDYDNKVVIGDYKTGSMYSVFLSEDIKRQLGFYALLYYLAENKYPYECVTEFLRYGIRDRIEVTPSLIKYITNEVNTFIKGVQSDLIGEYPLKESSLCSKYCYFFDICTGVKSLNKDKQKELGEIFNIKEKASE